jgi:hypothetical protein
MATSLQLIDEAVESGADPDPWVLRIPSSSLAALLALRHAIPAEVSSMFADHAGTTGYFSSCNAAKASVSKFRCAFTSSGGVSASH